jgi:aconitate hydratase
MSNIFGRSSTFETPLGKFEIFPLEKVESLAPRGITRLPYSIRILLESALRNYDDFQITERDIREILNWDPHREPTAEIAFKPGRVILQDFTGVPVVVDLAALRSAMVRMGGDPEVINPVVRVDLVIDHSIQIDYSASGDALEKNMKLEFERNRERYEFLKWGQMAFRNLGITPPGIGIVHQVNLEHLAGVVLTRDGRLFPDTLVGTDSHTTMINGLGVLGWGVGGIEAEAVMLDQPIYMLLPQVVGVRLTGSLREGATATDLVLSVTERLRKKGVVGKFVEFFGPSLRTLNLANRATIANMAPEYGATCGYFPVDAETLRYLRETGRDEALVATVEKYYKEQNLFRTEASPEPEYSDIVEVNLSEIEPSLAGPKRPQDRISLGRVKDSFHASLTAPIIERGYGLTPADLSKRGEIPGTGETLKHGDVVIASITSCTNTSNPEVLIAAGLLAKKAVERGLSSKPWVKTSMAPGSRVVTDYIEKAGLTPYLERLGFHTVGYGCTTCIGNSGPLEDDIVSAINDGSLIAAAVLSGNRNFEGRINPHAKANYLASPPLVIAYAIAGSVEIDLEKEPIGTDPTGKPVYLKELWPSREEIEGSIRASVTPDLYRRRYGGSMENPIWEALPAERGTVYAWDERSTYIQEPPFFTDMPPEPESLRDITGARVLVAAGDSITTDHISPAGSIAASSPAGQYLVEHGVPREEFNSYGARRGNDRVMTRGTFANVRMRNLLADGKEGWWTKHIPTGEIISIYDAALRYQEEKTPLIVLVGAEYGTGSSRDWAAKGTFLLGVRAVIAESFERIHRSNLAGMGVLPLQFLPGENRQSLGLTGLESFSITGIAEGLKPMQRLRVRAGEKEFEVICRLDTQVEIEYYRNGGILHTVLRKFLRDRK